MRHPVHRSFRLPLTYVALCEFMRGNRDFHDDDTPVWAQVWSDLLLCGEGLLNPLETPDAPAGQRPEDPRELGYDGQPIEIVPFGWEGVVHYGWAVLAPELDLDDHPCVSFAPGDDHAVWLGDNTKQALENLLVGRVANWSTWGEEGERSPAGRRSWAALCSALDLHPRLSSPDVTEGARSNRPIRPAVPPGWLYQETGDGIGVLTEATAVAPFDVEVDSLRPAEENVAQARELLAAGYAADALCVLKDSAPGPEVMRTMREAYQALGRTLHVERADAWLRMHY
jgi:hypothetical protein